MKLAFYQIYFEEQQLAEMYSFATPLRNEGVTNFFENEIIAREVPKIDADLISLCSWRLRAKRKDGWVPSLCKFPQGVDDLSEEKILRQDFDVAVLTPRSASHRMLAMSQMYHGGSLHDYAWDNAIAELQKFVKIPEEVTTPIYENHFIARKEIYNDYITNCLHPVIQFMSDRDVFFKDAGYAVKKERQDPEAVKRYREKTGRYDWPIAPFVLERLFSIWINDKNFKIVNL